MARHRTPAAHDAALSNNTMNHTLDCNRPKIGRCSRGGTVVLRTSMLLVVAFLTISAHDQSRMFSSSYLRPVFVEAWTTAFHTANRRTSISPTLVPRSLQHLPLLSDRPTPSSALAVSLSESETEKASSPTTPPPSPGSDSEGPPDAGPYPELGKDGIYHILNRQQHTAFLAENKDKLVVLKVFAPWCRACKGLEPKYHAIAQTPVYQPLPIVFADLSIQHNKNFVKELGVLALPSVQFYVGGSLSDNFPCGPSKVPILKRKVTQLINNHVDPKTKTLKKSSLLLGAQQTATAVAPSYNETVTSTGEEAAEAQRQVTANGVEAPARTMSETVNGYEPPTTMKESIFAALNATSAGVNGAVVEEQAPTTEEVPTTKKEVAAARPTSTEQTSPADQLSEATKQTLVQQIPYLADLNIADLDQVLSKGKLLTFEGGSIIMREGKPGRTFYILLDGEVEICQQTPFYYDPLVAPSTPSSSYLGAVINRLSPGDYFGERALITGEPRAASIRAASETVTCLTFDRDDFPASCVLSGKTRNTYKSDASALQDVNDKYGLQLSELHAQEVTKQIMDANVASQVRGSIYTPEVIRGVDTEEELNDNLVLEELESRKASRVEKEGATATPQQAASTEEDIVSLLTRFQMIRQVSQCVNYIVETRVQWGDPATRKRRSILVSRLTQAQRSQFTETFNLIDNSGDGMISLMELKTVMESIGETKSDAELIQALPKDTSEKSELSLEDFMGIMAEAEFYYLFQDIFGSLDSYNSGFVKASDLDRVLSGVRDLIPGNGRKSIIDVEDTEMLIDYEQFSRMMLGTGLV